MCRNPGGVIYPFTATPAVLRILAQIREDRLIAVSELDKTVPDTNHTDNGGAFCCLHLHGSAFSDRQTINNRLRRSSQRNGTDFEHIGRNWNDRCRIDGREANNRTGDACLPVKFADQITGATDDGGSEKRDAGHQPKMAKTNECALVNPAKSPEAKEKHTVG